MHLQSVMFEILMLTLIFLLKIPTHNYEFRINAKITVHCTFSSDSDEETGEFPIPLKKEVRYGAPTLRFLNCNYIYMLTCPFVKWQLKKKAENLRVLLKWRYFKPLVPSSSSASVDDSSSSEEYWRRWSVARIYGFTYVVVEMCVGVRTYVLS